jgi:ferrous iron transport protein B
MLSSVACAVPGILAARVIEDRRDRLATILTAPLMSCSARLPVYTLMIAAFLSVDQDYGWWVSGLAMFSMYLIGLVTAPLVALLLKRTLLRGQTPVFVMEMPLYKMPSLRSVLHRMCEAGWIFLRRAGTLILATMIVIWSLLYFPVTYFDAATNSYKNYDEEISQLRSSIEEEQQELDDLKDESETPETKARIEELKAKVEPVDTKIKKLQRDWTAQSLLGQAGKILEPVVRPLGWDWRIGMAALASFPAREVFVGTLGLIYSEGRGESDDTEFREAVGERLRSQTWDDEPGRRVFSVPVALSVMVFFALCCQCASTLAVIRRETNSWKWPVFTFVYMTVLAYVGALVVFQVSSRIL